MHHDSPQPAAQAARCWHAGLSLNLTVVVGCLLVLPAVRAARLGLDEVEGQSLSRIWAWALLAFLLLCPHVNQTEDLHLYLLPALAGVRLREAGWWGWLLLSAVVLVVWLSPARSLLPGWPGPVPAFAGKLVLVGLTLAWPGRDVRVP